jgi:hypothetical protein
MELWGLPQVARIGGVDYPLHTDYRDILRIFRHFADPDKPEWVRWKIALGLFYEGQIPPEHEGEAMAYLVEFVNCGQETKPGPKLLDWEQDASVIVADVNKVAGTEVRAVPFLHWWTFLAYFNAIGEGQLSTLVSIRDKLARGKKLEKWEQEYYRKNKSRVDLRKQYSAEDLVEQERLKRLIDGEVM